MVTSQSVEEFPSPRERKREIASNKMPKDWRSGPVSELADVGRGRVISHKEIAKSRVPRYPVYSSQTKNNGLMGFIDTFDFDGEYVTWTTDGANAGTVFHRLGKFNCTNVCGTIKVHAENAKYVAWALSRESWKHVSRQLGNPKLMNDVMKRVIIPIPPREEQDAIVEALSDAEGAVRELEKLMEKKRLIKQGAMQELLSGRRRLPGFSGIWELKSFDQVLIRTNAKNHQINSVDYQESGRYPVVDQGKKSIVGYSDRDDRCFKCPKGGVLIFGDHTCIIKFVDHDFVIGADGTQVLVAKPGCSTRFLSYLLQWDCVAPTGYNRHFKDLTQKRFRVPPLVEQREIAKTLGDLDAELFALETRLEKARQIKQGMMQELLTGRIRLV